MEDNHRASSFVCSIALVISSFDEEKTNCSESSNVVEFLRSIISSLICEEPGNSPVSSLASPQWPISNNVSLIGTWKYIQLGYSGPSRSIVDGISDRSSFLGVGGFSNLQVPFFKNLVDLILFRTGRSNRHCKPLFVVVGMTGPHHNPLDFLFRSPCFFG